MARVVLEKLTKAYREVVAVDAINLQIPDRELTVLVGPSGCGKTTTLRMIAGLEEITTGRIVIGDREVNRVAPKDRNIAMVFQNYALYPHMNVYKNMAFGLKMRRTPRAEIDRRVRETAALLGIEDLLQRKPAQLSGGQRQRVALGRAIVRDPAVFLFDEPLSNLDAKLRVVMRTELVKLQKRLETTTVHVTHDQVEAMTMGDRIVVMNRGKIQQVGPPMEVYDRPANRFVAEFIGSPPMNFLDGVLNVGQDHAAVDCGGVQLSMPPSQRESLASRLKRPSQPVTVGLRPEHLSVEPPANGDPSWSRFSAEVIVAQPLGAETIVELRAGSHELAARAEPHRQFTRGQTLDMFANVAKCHLFDRQTGESIAPVG